MQTDGHSTLRNLEADGGLVAERAASPPSFHSHPRDIPLPQLDRGGERLTETRRLDAEVGQRNLGLLTAPVTHAGNLTSAVWRTSPCFKNINMLTQTRKVWTGMHQTPYNGYLWRARQGRRNFLSLYHFSFIQKKG